ncbi:hypothetical protein JI58_03835 [Marinosulfonomonas sp. PRT-SC04]|nr:hypothetical protein JI58_03835 [Marinosulfonomonas sp. PRT-SC04]
MARELFETFTIAQALPTMAIVTMAAGLGKTTAAEAYQNQRPHVVLITLSPSILTHNKVLGEILEELGLQNIDKSRTRHNVTKALKRSGGNSLVIVDEAQNLDADCINELRVAVRDLGRSGLVLLGNEEKKTSYGSAGNKGGSPQLSRRVMARTTAMKVYEEDIPTFLDAWGLEDSALRTAATIILKKPGAYGSLTETLVAASMIARGNNRSLTVDDLRAAYRRRGEGDI